MPTILRFAIASFLLASCWAAEANPIANELAAWKARVAIMAGTYTSEVTEADPSLGVAVGTITQLIIDAQGNQLGVVVFAIEGKPYVCPIISAQADGLGFAEIATTHAITGQIEPDANGKPSLITVVVATGIDGSATMRAKIIR